MSSASCIFLLWVELETSSIWVTFCPTWDWYSPWRLILLWLNMVKIWLCLRLFIWFIFLRELGFHKDFLVAFQAISLIGACRHWFESLPWFFLFCRSVVKIYHWQVSVFLFLGQIWEIRDKIGASVLIFLWYHISLPRATSCLKDFRLKACIRSIHHKVVLWLLAVILRSLVQIKLADRLSLCQRPTEHFGKFLWLAIDANLLFDWSELFKRIDRIMAMTTLLVFSIVKADTGIKRLVHLNLNGIIDAIENSERHVWQ